MNPSQWADATTAKIPILIGTAHHLRPQPELLIPHAPALLLLKDTKKWEFPWRLTEETELQVKGVGGL